MSKRFADPAYQLGYQAREKGEGQNTNPYTGEILKEREAYLWDCGWRRHANEHREPDPVEPSCTPEMLAWLKENLRIEVTRVEYEDRFIIRLVLNGDDISKAEISL